MSTTEELLDRKFCIFYFIKARDYTPSLVLYGQTVRAQIEFKMGAARG
jgi:hypothetical protein